MIGTSSLDKVWEYIEELERWWKQARKRVIELVDEKNKLEEENKKLKEILNRIKELYEDEEEAELLNYLDEILDEI